MPSKNNLNSLKVSASENNTILNTPNKLKIKKINKGFQIDQDKARKWDAFVAHMKYVEDKKRGSELINEALELIFEKYNFG